MFLFLLHFMPFLLFHEPLFLDKPVKKLTLETNDVKHRTMHETIDDIELILFAGMFSLYLQQRKRKSAQFNLTTTIP